MKALPLITNYLQARHQGSESDGVALPLSRAIRGPKVIGYAAIVLFFGGFGAWATIASLSSAAIAPGLVSPDGNRKTVEHLEGGIVREIRVREGDHVKAGQVLVVLEDVRARAEFEELQERFVHLTSIEARLLAELEEADSIAPPAQLDDFDPEIFRPAVSAQQRLFESRQATLQGRVKILGQRVLQLEAEIDGLHEVIAAANEQLELIAQEIEGVEILYKKGLSPLPKLLALKRAQAGLRGERASSRARIARHEQSIGETRLQLLTMREERGEQVADELSSC
jgi:HlyD family secretion protein/epimerase transport system membrane fusion protein